MIPDLNTNGGKISPIELQNRSEAKRNQLEIAESTVATSLQSVKSELSEDMLHKSINDSTVTVLAVQRAAGEERQVGHERTTIYRSWALQLPRCPSRRERLPKEKVLLPDVISLYACLPI